jgi:hypothetical protein
MKWSNPTDPFSRIKYIAVEIVATILFIVWLIRAAWRDLGL